MSAPLCSVYSIWFHFFVLGCFVQRLPSLQLVEDLLEGFSEHGWKNDVFTPTPTRGVTDKQRKEYAHKRVEVKYDGKLTIHMIR